MRILLFGEYSNVHHTLCEALRRAGHEVLLVSDGDGWKDYPRDVDLRRTKEGPLGSLLYLSRLASLLPKLRGFDVVQIVNPIFLDVKPRWNRWVFDYLKRHNGIMSVGCFGDDYYVVSRMQDDRYLSYTDFYADGRTIGHEVNRRRISTWTEGPKAELTRYVMRQADCLVACLYEYWKVYDTPEFQPRLRYIPLPIDVRSNHLTPQPPQTAASAASNFSNPSNPSNLSNPSNSSNSSNPSTRSSAASRPIHVLFAAQKLRGQMKGTDQLEPLFDRLALEFPDAIELCKVESVPFEQYQRLVAEADVVVDQLYSFTPAMGALESMARGKVVISGYEPEYRTFIDGPEESGIINLRPFDDEGNYELLRRTLTDRNKIARLQECSQAFVRKYHDADDVARQYVEFWSLASSSRRPSQR